MLESPNWTDIHSVPLFRPTFTPVCAPALLRGDRPLLTPGDLRHHSLLYSRPHVRIWNAWLSLAGVDTVDPSVGLLFDSSSHAYQAARQGAGVALGQTFLVLEDILAGRLVAPFGLAVQHRRNNCIVCLEARRTEPHIAAFHEWISAEARATVDRVEEVFGGRLEAHFF